MSTEKSTDLFDFNGKQWKTHFNDKTGRKDAENGEDVGVDYFSLQHASEIKRCSECGSLVLIHKGHENFNALYKTWYEALPKAETSKDGGRKRRRKKRRKSKRKSKRRTKRRRKRKTKRKTKRKRRRRKR